MSLLVVGSVAFDSVETPHGTVTDALGGSASFFSYAASFFTPVRLVAVVGEDFPPAHRAPSARGPAGGGRSPPPPPPPPAHAWGVAISTPRAWSSRKAARRSA